ncbi:MAG TPA: inositol monophosphatase family protein [Actinomycetota bacterium]|nr:inositol monophosphatase family protein [Actinomycetota bacterium]
MIRTIAVEAAREAGEVLMSMKPSGISSKSSPTDLVTDADRASEEIIFRKIRAARPEDTVTSEEGSLFEGTSGIKWIIDPLDGTTNYAYGIPQWAVSIGVEGKVRIGVVYDPNRDEVFTDISDQRPSQKTDLSTSLVATGFSYSAEIRKRQGEVAAKVVHQVRDLRRAGAAALDLAWVAAGRLDGYYEDDTHPWDKSAGITMIEASGGFVVSRDALVIAAGTKELLTALERLVTGK